MSDRYKAFFEEIGVTVGGSAIDPSKTPEVLYKEHLSLGLYTEAAEVSEKITDAATQITAQEEIMRAVIDKARFSIVSSVLHKLGGGVTKPLLPKLLERYRRQRAYNDAVEVIRLYGPLLWPPIINEYLGELIGKEVAGSHTRGRIDDLEDKLLAAKQSGSDEEEEDIKKEIGRVESAAKKLICILQFGSPFPPSQQGQRQGGKPQGDNRGPKKPFRDKRDRD